MERRYRLMAEAKVRNLEGYNRGVRDQPADAGEKAPEKLPFIVIVIDELADLMMVAGKDVEQSICRIAQKARAAGIHLILATQRPSVDVITGLIKANLPTRISFQVSSKIDSRTILDQMGAEQLLGQGDSLVLSGGRELRRVHGAFVSDGEVHALVEYLRTQGRPDYREEVFEVPTAADAAAGDEETDADDKYDEAVDLVVDKGQCSVSMVQRYLRIGYNRASRMVERMEREGLVTPPGSGGVRKVLARSHADGGGVIE
jgi:S-DNA-T family DNA segregation ATPase FtsK/SpoIIIE